MEKIDICANYHKGNIKKQAAAVASLSIKTGNMGTKARLVVLMQQYPPDSPSKVH